MISSFQDLLEQIGQQKDASRLLMLFAESEVNKKAKKRDEKKGAIKPVMCVDKLPAEIASFEALVKEADGISPEWNMIFIAGLNGNGDVPPTSDDADPYLNQMVNTLTSGQDLSKYIVFDREENHIVMQAK